ncbi:MAG TPA: sel1 repeat family protein [Gammaproteobacteria bacterium]|nr:sel1 repeat family protein [Gammaproteobacteria bacterium]
MSLERFNLQFSYGFRAERTFFLFLFFSLLAPVLLLSSVQARALSQTGATPHKMLDSSVRSMGQQAYFGGYALIQGVKAFKSKDFYRAERIWLPLAQDDNSKAQFFLGMLYESASNDLYKALYWYRRAAELGDREAQHNLGLAYARGLGVKKNIPEAVKWWRAASMKGNTDSQYNLGIIYATGGDGVSRNFKEAKRWWLLAAANGDPLAQYNLGAMYANGVAGKQSYCEAARWWSRSQSNGFRQADIALENLGRRHLDASNCR